MLGPKSLTIRHHTTCFFIRFHFPLSNFSYGFLIFHTDHISQISSPKSVFSRPSGIQTGRDEQIILIQKEQ